MTQDHYEGITLEQMRAALNSLKEKGLIVDSGRRRNGQIVWEAVPPKDKQQ